MSVASELRLMGLAPPRSLPPQVAAARATIESALGDLLTISDSALTRVWPWRNGRIELRYAFYRCYEVLAAATARVEGGGAGRAESARILADAIGAQWELHGILIPLTDAEIDAVPEGEWSIRQTLAHLIGAQERYTVGAAWAVHRIRAGGDLPLVPEALSTSGAGVTPELPGDKAAVRTALDAPLDAALGLFAGVDDELALSAPAVWARYDVPMRFRLGRCAAHLREHTVQVEKTLALLGRQPSEVERLVRVVAAAYGRLEGACFGLDPVPERLGDATAEVAGEARSASLSASA